MKTEQDIRQSVIEKIEGETGSLFSVPWSDISTRDLIILANAVHGKVIPEHLEFLNL